MPRDSVGRFRFLAASKTVKALCCTMWSSTAINFYKLRLLYYFITFSRQTHRTSSTTGCCSRRIRSCRDRPWRRPAPAARTRPIRTCRRDRSAGTVVLVTVGYGSFGHFGVVVGYGSSRYGHALPTTRRVNTVAVGKGVGYGRDCPENDRGTARMVR